MTLENPESAARRWTQGRRTLHKGFDVSRRLASLGQPRPEICRGFKVEKCLGERFELRFFQTPQLSESSWRNGANSTNKHPTYCTGNMSSDLVSPRSTTAFTLSPAGRSSRRPINSLSDKRPAIPSSETITSPF